MQIDLTPADLKLLVVLLDRAGAEFSNHGCNDFHLLRDGGLAPGEAEELKTKMQVEFPGEEEPFDNDSQYDWLLFRRYEKLFQKALETPARAVVTEGEGITITSVSVSPETRAGLNTGGARLPPLDHT